MGDGYVFFVGIVVQNVIGQGCIFSDFMVICEVIVDVLNNCMFFWKKGYVDLLSKVDIVCEIIVDYDGCVVVFVVCE